MNFLRKKRFIVFILGTLLLSSCSRMQHRETIRIACTPIPNTQILELVKSELGKWKIDLNIVEVEDYNIPNKLLNKGEIDANFFQHIAYLNDSIKNNGYEFSILCPILIAPVGVYSNKIENLGQIKNSSKDHLIIAVPNDKSNEHRALNLLIDSGILRLKGDCSKDDFYITAINVEGYLKKVKIVEVDAVILPRCLPDVDLAVIPTGVALLAGLHPEKNALILENSTNSPEYVNVIVVRTKDANKLALLKFKEIITSSEMKRKLNDNFKNYGLIFV